MEITSRRLHFSMRLLAVAAMLPACNSSTPPNPPLPAAACPARSALAIAKGTTTCPMVQGFTERLVLQTRNPPQTYCQYEQIADDVPFDRPPLNDEWKVQDDCPVLAPAAPGGPTPLPQDAL